MVYVTGGFDQPAIVAALKDFMAAGGGVLEQRSNKNLDLPAIGLQRGAGAIRLGRRVELDQLHGQCVGHNRAALHCWLVGTLFPSKWFTTPVIHAVPERIWGMALI